jgi:hypothetical protein
MRSSDRKEKLAAALRANLKRRKARARALDGGAKAQKSVPAGEAPAPPETRPNIAANKV